MNTEPKYKVGIIGCGRKGTEHARGYQIHPLTELVTAADPDQENLNLFRDRFGISSVYTDYKVMLEKEKIDIAAPILPVSANPDAVISSARAGVKAIFSEKPISASLEEADQMVEECESRGIPFACGDSYRSFPQLWEARSIIESGDLGDVQSINLYQSTNEISGGGCQGLSVMRLFAWDANVVWVTGWVENDPDSDKDQGMGGYVKFDNGIECFIHLKNAAKKGIEVILERGIFFSDWHTFRLWTFGGNSKPGQLPKLKEIEGRFPNSGIGDMASYGEDGLRLPGFRQMSGIRSIVNSLENGTEPACTGANMLKSLEIAIALRESHRQGHAPIKLPLKNRTLKIYPKEGRWLNKKQVYGEEAYAEMIGVFSRSPQHE